MEYEYVSETEKALETALLQNSRDMFGIYQLKHGDDLHYHRFTPYEVLRSTGNDVQRDNYILVYIGVMEDGLTLGHIFHRFSMERPVDFHGHSLSISDIIVAKRDGAVTAHYVDDFDFLLIPSFIN